MGFIAATADEVKVHSHMCVPLHNHNAGCNLKLTYILSCTHCHLVSPKR